MAMGRRNVDFEWNRELQRWEFLYLDTTVDPSKHSAVYVDWGSDQEDTVKALMSWFKMILRENEKNDHGHS